MHHAPSAPAEKVAKELSHVRKKKMAKIRKRIQNGKYEVSNWDLAKALFLSQ